MLDIIIWDHYIYINNNNLERTEHMDKLPRDLGIIGALVIYTVVVVGWLRLSRAFPTFFGLLIIGTILGYWGYQVIRQIIREW